LDAISKHRDLDVVDRAAGLILDLIEEGSRRGLEPPFQLGLGVMDGGGDEAPGEHLRSRVDEGHAVMERLEGFLHRHDGSTIFSTKSGGLDLQAVDELMQ
jgi:hypothetical protein